MTTSPHAPVSSTAATTRVPLRIRLGTSSASSRLDGAWWPQSRDLQSEAADLVDHFPAEVGRIERLLFSRPDWNQATGAPSVRRIHAARGAIKVGSFPNDDTHTMVLKLSTGQRLRLLVVPSDTGPAAAASVMHEVAG